MIVLVRCYVAKAGEFGVVANDTTADQLFEMDGERHEAGDTRDSSQWCIGLRNFRFPLDELFLGSLPASLDRDLKI